LHAKLHILLLQGDIHAYVAISNQQLLLKTSAMLLPSFFGSLVRSARQAMCIQAPSTWQYHCPRCGGVEYHVVRILDEVYFNDYEAEKSMT
jgi:hypothetical protein